ALKYSFGLLVLYTSTPGAEQGGLAFVASKGGSDRENWGLLCGGLLFTCNAVMWTFLAKALRYSSSSTRTTVTTTASNFISSAFLGQLIFGEAQITLWWVGISLTFSGLLVLQRVSPQDGHHNTVAKDE
uniref:Transmembrane protein 42b n=1 Tax=Dicentrarchus labrax TaxID=13489 RepID=A0A8P4KCF3_DICLA